MAGRCRRRGRGGLRGARIALTLLACVAHALRPTIPIVAEGPDWLVVHKPAGVPCHRRVDQPGILELVGGADLKLCHRLDDGTSGCLVLAKGRQAAAAIGDAFAAKRVAKVYVGLTASRPSKKKGVIVGDMVRSRRAQWRLTRDCGPAAACTWLSRSVGLGPGEGDPAARLIVARPLTGKTHQIRIALCGNQKFTAPSTSTPSTRRLLDGVAVHPTHWLISTQAWPRRARAPLY